MQYDPSDLKPRERYKVLTSFVLPRPIAWVTSWGQQASSTRRRSASSMRSARPAAVHVRRQQPPDGRVKEP